MLDFFPFTIKHCYSLQGNKGEYVKRLEEELLLSEKYDGYVHDSGFYFERKKSVIYNNKYGTYVRGAFNKVDNNLFLMVMFSMNNYVKVVTAILFFVGILAGLYGYWYRDYGALRLSLKTLAVPCLGRFLSYVCDEREFLNSVEHALGYPEKIKPVKMVWANETDIDESAIP